MFKSYRGFALQSGHEVSYRLEFRCSRCGSEDVVLDTSDLVPHFCDGSPSTADELVHWTCSACNHRALGSNFVARKVDGEDAIANVIVT